MKKYLPKIERLLPALFWVFLYGMLVLQALPQTTPVQSFLFPFLMLITIYPFSRYLSGNLLQRSMKQKKTKVFIGWFILFSFVNGMIFYFYVWLFSRFEKAGYFPLSDYFDLDSWPFFFYLPVFISSGMIMNISICGLQFYLENSKLKKTLLESQLQTLRQQITPHFMFNVLNHIHILMQSDVESASSLLIKYSEILRYQLYEGGKDVVSLERDIRFSEDYIAIEEIRWKDKLTVDYRKEIEDEMISIPALLFIPFIENAFKHVSKFGPEKSYVKIHFRQQDGMIRLLVENTRSLQHAQNEQSSGLGLKNIRERLHILYGDKFSLSIDETDMLYRVELEIHV